MTTPGRSLTGDWNDAAHHPRSTANSRKRARQEEELHLAEGHQQQQPAAGYQRPRFTAECALNSTHPAPMVQAQYTVVVAPSPQNMHMVNVLDDATVRYLLACAATHEPSGQTYGNVVNAYRQAIDRIQAQQHFQQQPPQHGPHAPPSGQSQEHQTLLQQAQERQLAQQAQQVPTPSSASLEQDEVHSDSSEDDQVPEQDAYGRAHEPPKQTAAPCQDEQDFYHLSDEAWRILHAGPASRLSGSKQFHAASDAYNDVTSIIATIREQTLPASSYKTKLSALKTLSKIGEVVLLVDDALGQEVRKKLQYDPCLVDGILDILYTMSRDQCVKAGKDRVEPDSTLLKEVKWLWETARGHCLDGFDEESSIAIRLLNGTAAKEVYRPGNEVED